MDTKTTLICESRHRCRPSRPRSPRLRVGERGASLIEIMVVLVILLIGVFLAIRIFPNGFSTLRANENRTVSTQLAQRMLALAKGDAVENLPQGVLAAYRDTSTGALIVDTNQDPDNLGAYVAGTKNPYFDDINHFHYIKGEAVKIPLPTAGNFTNQNGSVYTLKFGPLYMDTAVGDRNNAPSSSNTTLYNSYLSVNGGPLVGTNIESNNTAGSALGANGAYVGGYLRGAQSYLIDYGDNNDAALIMFSPRAPAGRSDANRHFTIKYSYLPSGASQAVAISTTIDVPDSTSPVWQAIPVVGPGTGGGTAVDVQPGSVTVTRLFDRIGYNATWDTNDPYQYKLYSNNLMDTSGTVTTFANIGALMFNPAGANYSETTPYGQRPFMAYVDYAVLDWHIIRDDIDVPSITPNTDGVVPVHTALSPIRQVGDTQSDLTLYNNLFGDPNPAVDYDIVIYNLGDPSGTPLTQRPYKPGNLASDGDYYVDANPRGGSYRTGTIYINTNRVKAGTPLRVLYQADGDWAVALQKAYSQYTDPLDSSGVPQKRPTYNAYDEFGIEGLGQNARIFFPGCDLNKTVTVTIEYTYNDTNQNNNPVTRRLASVQLIPDTRVQEPAVDRNGNSVTATYAVASINPALGKSYIPSGEQTNFNNATGWRIAGPNGVGIAYGTAVKARVIWHDNDTSNVRWRVQDMDSNLTPTP